MILESCFWAAFGAILPDIDHFIAARSTSISLARQLPVILYVMQIDEVYGYGLHQTLHSLYWLNLRKSLPHCITNQTASCLIINIRSNDGSSQRWIARQRSDPYVKRARLESYRCRSAFKLLQLNDKIPGGLFKPGDIVVDCGAAPGSWCQVATSLIKSNDHNKISNKQNEGLVIAFDLANFAPLPGVIAHCGVDLNNSSECIHLISQSIFNHFNSNNDDKNCEQMQHERQELMPGVDIVLSDTAPNVTGMREIDVPAMIKLAHNILRIAISVSKQGATLVIKLFESAETKEFKQTVSQFYTFNLKRPSFTRLIKPEASRKESSEVYLVARGFQLPHNTQDGVHLKYSS
ncbi:unnamed protein product [Schistosoma turkestanicum]|nr:unnamed protein product [Schistosoma turkestanicum]